MRYYLFILPFLFMTQTIFSQSKIEDDIEYALVNAKKGVYWLLSNIPKKKSKIEKDLIAEDRLIASAKLNKEFNGVRIESTGYYDTHEVTIMIYRSNDTLIKDGYLKKEEVEPNSEED